MPRPILEARNLKLRYPFRPNPLAPAQGWVQAVSGVSLALQAGESVGLVGESGCGKSTLSRLLCGLIPPDEGEILFEGQPLLKLNSRDWKRFRQSVQLIFQDPMASLNPLMRIGDAIAEPLKIHGLASGSSLDQEVASKLEEVGLDPAWAHRRPSQLSGGQRQRVGIARALSLKPQVLICDEPVSSLDLSVQSQILKLLTELRQKRGLTLLFISHSLRTVGALADRMLVMHSGQIVEEGTNPELFRSPQHAYTQVLVKLATERL